MPGKEAPTPGISSRRSACDRCHGQKLRCLRTRQDPEGRCDRCAKVDAQCLQSPKYHMRNYSAQEDAAAIASRKRRRVEKCQSSQSAVRPSSTGVGTTFDWPLNNPVPKPANGATDFTASDWTSLANPVTAPPSNLSAVAEHSWDTIDFSQDHFVSAHNFDRCFAVPGVTADASTSNPALSSALQSTLDTQSPILQTHPESEDSFGVSLYGNLEALDLSTQAYDIDGGSSNHLHQLSRINISLVAQLSQMTENVSQVNLKTLIAPTCGQDAQDTAITPLEDILNSTSQFLDVLKMVAALPQDLPLSSEGNAPSLSQASRSYNVDHENSSESAWSSDNAVLTSPEDSSTLSDFPPVLTPTEPRSSNKMRIDSTTLLQILICYIHILRLYVALFWHIQQYLYMISTSEERTINPLPGLCGFQNFPLQSGNLQATVIIQLVINMFEKMEILLGLPREFRIGSREGGHHGLLAGEGFTDIVKETIRKEHIGKSEEGKGGIKSLRRDMKKAKRLLRTCIPP